MEFQKTSLTLPIRKENISSILGHLNQSEIDLIRWKTQKVKTMFRNYLKLKNRQSQMQSNRRQTKAED